MNYTHTMSLKIIAIISVCFFFFSAQATDSLSNFSGIYPQGNLPECFVTLSADKYKVAKEKISREDTRFEKKSKKDFYLKSNFVVDRILQSGKVIYGDPVTQYLNDVADVILKDYPELRSRIQFFTTKSQYTNAFATDQGIIFVNTGLIARVHSEAELAFVLAHEISHIYEKHVISMHIERDKMIKQKGAYRRISLDDNFLNVNMMSQEQESQADEIAFTKFYRNSEYCLDELDSAFLTLLFANKPLNESPFDNSFFETEFYKFPDNYTRKSLDTVTIAQLEALDTVANKESTHPATVVRRLAIQRLMIKDKNTGRKKFIVSEERFHQVQILCQFESIRQMMFDREYTDAIYNCYVLLKTYPDNVFLDRTLATALYNYSIYQTKGGVQDFKEEYSKQSTEIKQLSYFLSKLSDEEMNILALKQVVDIQKKHGHTKYLDAIAEQLYESMFLFHRTKKKDLLSAQNLQDNLDSNDPAKGANRLYFHNAFAHVINDADVSVRMAHYDTLQTALIESDNANSKELDKARTKIKKEKRVTERREKLYGKRLGLDKIVVVDPFYFKLNQYKKDKLRLIESERKQLRFSKRMMKCAAISNLDVQLFNPKEFSQSQGIEFRNLSSLKEWFDERLEHDLTYDVIPYSTMFMQPVADYFGTVNVLWTGVIAERYKKDLGAGIALAIEGSYGLAIPLVLVWALIPQYETQYFSLLYDITTGENLLKINETIKTSDFSGDFVNSVTYDAFFQINKTK